MQTHLKKDLKASICIKFDIDSHSMCNQLNVHIFKSGHIICSCSHFVWKM